MSNSRPRALVVGPLPPPMGGVGALVRAILDSPLSDTWDLDVFNLSKPQQEGKPGVVTPWDVAWTLVHAITLPWRLLTRRPRVVLLQSTADTGYIRDFLLLLECRLFLVPVVMHWHGTPESPAFPGTSGWRPALFRAGVAMCARVIVLAEPYRAPFERFVPAEQLVVVPNFVDGARFRRPRPAEAPSGALRVVTMGRVGPLKGTDVLLAAIEALRARGHDVRAVLVGSGETPEALCEVQAHPLVQAGIVRLAGAMGDERAFVYAESDLLAHPTRVDSFPMALLEGMAAGLPIVASDVGAIRWMLADGACGDVLPPGDPTALAASLESALADPLARRMRGEVGRMRQERSFDSRVVAVQLDRVLRAAVEA